MMIVWLTCWLWLVWWSRNWYNHRVTHMNAALMQVWGSRGLFSGMSGLGLGLVWRWLSHESMRYVWHMWYVWYAWYVSVAYVVYVVCAVYEVYVVNARCAVPVVVKWSCFEVCVHLIKKKNQAGMCSGCALWIGMARSPRAVIFDVLFRVSFCVSVGLIFSFRWFQLVSFCVSFCFRWSPGRA